MHDNSLQDVGTQERSLAECLTEAVRLAVSTKNVEWLRGLARLLSKQQKTIQGSMENAEHNEELETANQAFVENT